MSNIILQAESTTVVLNGEVLNNLAEQDAVIIQQPNPRTGRVNSERGVTVIKRNDAEVTDLVIKVQRYSADDVLLNSWKESNKIVVLNGSVKESFNRDGTDMLENWVLEAGTFTTSAENVKNNQEPTGISEYTIQFRRGTRVI